MSKIVTDWTGFKACTKCGAQPDRPCWSMRTSSPTPSTQAHPGRPKDDALRRKIGQANSTRTRAFNRTLGLP